MPNPLPIRLLACAILLANTVVANPFTPAASKKSFTEIKMLSTFLLAANGNMADGNRVVFDAQYSNSVDMYDAVKMMNPGENFGLLRSGYTLAVEARQPIADGDTLHYRMTNLIPQVYTMRIEVQYLENTAAVAELVDRFTNTRRYISLGSTTSFPVAVTTDPASKASNRFYLVFSAMGGPLPVKFTDTKASQLNSKSIGLQWNVEEELNVDHYEVERKDNDGRFETIGKVRTNNSGSKLYQYKDNLAAFNTVFYRIRAVDMDGKINYSPIVKVKNTAISYALFTAYPNPLKGTQLNIRMQDAATGSYNVKLVNTFGQPAFNGKIKLTQADQTIPFVIGNKLVAGIYTLQITGENGESYVQQLTVQQ